MKKFVASYFLVTVLLIVSPFLNAQKAKPKVKVKYKPCFTQKFSISVGAGMRNFSNTLYKDVHGSSSITYNVDFGVKIIPGLEAFLHTDYLKNTGKTTYTKEDTTLKITPVEFGLRYLFTVDKTCKLKLFPYIGAGAGYYMIKEENVIGNVKENKMGFFVEGGLRYYPVKSFFIDLKIKDVMLKTKAGVKLDGFTYMGGIGISF